MSPNLWEAVRKHAEAIGEPSLSHVARKLLRERLTQLGSLKEHQIRPSATEVEAATLPRFLMGPSCQLSLNISSDYRRVGRGFWASEERVAIPLHGAVVRLHGTGPTAKKRQE